MAVNLSSVEALLSAMSSVLSEKQVKLGLLSNGFSRDIKSIAKWWWTTPRGSCDDAA